MPYEGGNAAIKAEFPKGFLPSYGSGLAFKCKRADGTLEFYGLTDRGPNGDGPKVPATAPATGMVLKKYQPCTGAADLPAVLAKRRPNRGMEGLALDAGNGRLTGFLQSPLTDNLAAATYVASFAGSTVCTTDTGTQKRIERYARFTRWVEFDPSTGKLCYRRQSPWLCSWQQRPRRTRLRYGTFYPPVANQVQQKAG